MFGLPEKIVVFDLECTTWEGAAARGWSCPGEHREVVQLGATIVETAGFTELANVLFYVRPKINPILSKYFIDLTHITQEKVDEYGVDFRAFLEEFSDFCAGLELYCFDKAEGSRIFDRDVLEENCRLLGIEFPFEKERFHNVNKIFHQHGYAVKQSGATPEAFGIKLPARPHDALNDTRGLIVGLKAIANACDQRRKQENKGCGPGSPIFGGLFYFSK